MRYGRGTKGNVSDRPSPAVHSLTSSSCHRPKDGPEGGVTRGRGREESEPSESRSSLSLGSCHSHPHSVRPFLTVTTVPSWVFLRDRNPAAPHATRPLISSLGSPLRGVRWGEGWETCREMSGREVRKRRVTDDQGLGLTVHLVHFPRLSHRVSLSSLTLIVRHLRSRPPSVA